jgi:hypothetical protein
VDTGAAIRVSVDWEKAEGAASGEVSVTGAGTIVTVQVAVEWTDITNVPPMTFIQTHNTVSIEAEHTTNRVAKSGAEWKTINNYGRTLSSVKRFPAGSSFDRPEEAPYLEYRLLVHQDGEYSLTAYIAPTNQLSPVRGLKYAAGFDGEPPSPQMRCRRVMRPATMTMSRGAVR